MITKKMYAKIPLIASGVIALAFTSLSSDLTQGIVYTPKGSSVSVFHRSGSLDPNDIESKRKAYKKAYPNAVFIAEATLEYNCHHYAWHMASGNSDKWWMNYMDRYISDGSYKQVAANSSEATHLVYFEEGVPSHSAVKSAVPGKLDSKWGALWLVRHSVKDCPYELSDIRYYKLNMWITGPSTIDPGDPTPVIYTLNNAPQGATITWTVTPNGCLIDGQGTPTISVSPRSQMHVSVQTSVGGSKVNVPEVVTSFSQRLQINDIELFRYGQNEYDFTLKALCNVGIENEIECVWECDDQEVEFYDVQYPDDAMFIDGIGRFTAVRFPRDGTYTISAYALAVNDSSLGSSRVFTKTFTINRTQSIDPPLLVE